MPPAVMLMSLLTPAVVVGWLLAPYLLAFFGALLPALGELPLLLCCLATVLMALPPLLLGESISLNLIGTNGISLSLDATAAWFLLLNGVVLGATRLASRNLEGSAGPLVPAVMLGGLNTCFVVTDLISLYVALEVVGIAAFLLQLRRDAPRSFWIALRYLLVASTAMTLYLIGTGLVYVRTGSFSMEAIAGLELGSAQVLILLGLFSKGGLFLPGLWLPRSHAAARPDVALTEAMVGTLLSTTLYVIALRSSMTLRLEDRRSSTALKSSADADAQALSHWIQPLHLRLRLVHQGAAPHGWLEDHGRLMIIQPPLKERLRNSPGYDAWQRTGGVLLSARESTP